MIVQNGQLGSAYLEWGTGALNLDMTPTGGVPAADRQVARQVLISYCLAVNGCHLGLCQTKKYNVLSSHLG